MQEGKPGIQDAMHAISKKLVGNEWKRRQTHNTKIKNYEFFVSVLLNDRSDHTCSALAWHSDGRAFAFQWLYSKSCDLWSAFAPCNTWSSGSSAICWMGATPSQLNLPSQMPLSTTGCGRLQLGASNCDTSVALLQVVAK